MRLFSWFFILVLSVFVTGAAASNHYFPSVMGKWITFNEKTNKASSVIAVSRKGNVVEGKIIAAFPSPGDKPLTYCHHCKGADKHKKIIGLNIIKGMKCHRGSCFGGTITDPRNGKVYHATMHLVDRGYLLKVRGYIGISLFGKTVVWKRFLPKAKAA